MPKNLIKTLQKKVLICDGAMGTLLLKEGLKPGRPPEILNLENPELLKSIHKQYVEAGAEIILTNTFGANSLKLKGYGLENKGEELISKAVAIAKAAAGKNTFVVGDIGPLGIMIEPLGELTFSEAVDIFKNMCRVLNRAGVEAIIIETMSDIKEVKAAVIAAKEETKLPIWVQMTFDISGKTLYGTSPEVAIAVCEGLGVDIIGTNCGLGPKELLPVVKAFCKNTSLPVAVQPNAGLPVLEDNKTVYKLSPEEMRDYAFQFTKLGVNILGGCCGTTPRHIEALAASDFKLVSRGKRYIAKAASRTQVVELREAGFPLVIGERINPTARKGLTKEIITGKTSLIKDNALQQVENGADFLDLNVGVSEGDEAAFMLSGVKAIESVVNVPLVLDTTNSRALEAGLEACSGRPLINSVSGKQESMNSVLPLAKKYGALVLVLPVNEAGIPKKAEERVEVAEKVAKEALSLGLRKEDLIIDGITLTVSTSQAEVGETLRALPMLKVKGFKTVLGVSNISYGLPNRVHINSAFLSIAMQYGLDIAIINPNSKPMMDTLYAAAVLTGQDYRAGNFLKRVRREEQQKSGVTEQNATAKTKERSIEDTLKEAILLGDKDNIVEYIETALQQGLKPMDISLSLLIPALEEVGDKFGKKEYFLPQLILSAETMQKAFVRIKREFSPEEKVSPGRILMATVEGDVHDIGKNIVITILESHGYYVHDIGKNVLASQIIAEAVKHKVDIIGLSALMTTTMPKMQETINLLREEGLKIKTILGGAVVSDFFAKRVGADGYAKDALEAVKVVKKVLEK